MLLRLWSSDCAAATVRIRYKRSRVVQRFLCDLREAVRQQLVRRNRPCRQTWLLTLTKMHPAGYIRVGFSTETVTGGGSLESSG